MEPATGPAAALVVVEAAAGTVSVEVQRAKTVRTVRARAPNVLEVRVIDRSPIISISIVNMPSRAYCQSIISNNDILLIVLRQAGDEQTKAVPGGGTAFFIPAPLRGARHTHLRP